MLNTLIKRIRRLFQGSSLPVEFHEQRDHEKAIVQLDEAIRLDPQNAKAYFMRGSAYLQLDQHERAIKDIDEAIRLDPRSAQAYNNRGSAYIQLGRLERAIEDLDEAVRLDPQNTQAYYNRALRTAD